MDNPLPFFNSSIILPNSTIIVGLSGGPDSICLLHHLATLRHILDINLIAVHLDHEWQTTSKIAGELCQNICDQLNIKFILKRISELKFDHQWNGSQEELGRSMRRHLLESIAQEYQASAIALAHHAQDQQETFFIRLIRGSSLTGLTGMRIQDGLYIRPLLQCSKSDVIDYLEQYKLSYYTDPSNHSDIYLRNRIRHHLMPALQNADVRSLQNVSSTMEHLRQVDDFLNDQVHKTLLTISTDTRIAIAPFLELHNVLQQRILLHIMIQAQVCFTPSQKLFNEILRFLKTSRANKHIVHPSWMVKKHKHSFEIKNLRISNLSVEEKFKKSDKTL